MQAPPRSMSIIARELPTDFVPLSIVVLVFRWQTLARAACQASLGFRDLPTKGASTYLQDKEVWAIRAKQAMIVSMAIALQKTLVRRR